MVEPRATGTAQGMPTHSPGTSWLSTTAMIAAMTMHAMSSHGIQMNSMIKRIGTICGMSDHRRALYDSFLCVICAFLAEISAASANRFLELKPFTCSPNSEPCGRMDRRCVSRGLLRALEDELPLGCSEISGGPKPLLVAKLMVAARFEKAMLVSHGSSVLLCLSCSMSRSEWSEPPAYSGGTTYN